MSCTKGQRGKDQPAVQPIQEICHELRGIARSIRRHLAHRYTHKSHMVTRPSIYECFWLATNLVCGSAEAITISKICLRSATHVLLFVLLVEIIERGVNWSLGSMIFCFHSSRHELAVRFLFRTWIETLVLSEVWGQAIEVPTFVPQRCPAIVVLFTTTDVPSTNEIGLACVRRE